MRIAEQIKEGQHRANKILVQIKKELEYLQKFKIAKETFKEEIEAQLEELFKKEN